MLRCAQHDKLGHEKSDTTSRARRSGYGGPVDAELVTDPLAVSGHGVIIDRFGGTFVGSRGIHSRCWRWCVGETVKFVERTKCDDSDAGRFG